MNDKVEAVLNAIGKHYKSELTICNLAARTYNPHHADCLFHFDVQQILDDLTELNLIKMINVSIIADRFYKINKKAIMQKDTKRSNNNEIN